MIMTLNGKHRQYSLIGAIIVLVEVIDHLLLPILFVYLHWYKTAALFAIVPITEISVYPLALLKAIGKTLTKRLDK